MINDLYIDELTVLLHVIVASVLSGAIGYERGKIDKPAGVRTNMLVGGSVALLIALGEIIVSRFKMMGFEEYIATDPTRIIQAIIMGISFIGAGMVMQIEKDKEVKYLTSAATILFSSGIGMSVALKQYILAVGITIFILFINYFLGLYKAKGDHSIY
ncbi:MAG: MgtC/SapB family protein [Cyclobacteriaceae bacterium]